MQYPDFFFLYLPGTETVGQHLLLQGAGPMVSHCSKFPWPPLLLDIAWGCSANACWGEVTCIPPRSSPMLFRFSGLLEWWHSGQPWKPHVEDGGTAINLGAQMTKHSCCSVIHTKKELLLCWSHYILGLLTLGPTNTLSGHFGDPKPSVTQMTSLKPTTVPVSSYENQRCGESTQGKTDRRKHLHGSAIGICSDGCCCSDCIRHSGCTCFTDVQVRHGYF